MHYLSQRVQVICDQLKKQDVIQNVRIPDWKYKEGSFLRPSDADACDDKE